MSLKRAGTQGCLKSSTKRARISSEYNGTKSPRSTGFAAHTSSSVDPLYGQRGAFPVTVEVSNDDDVDSTTSLEALEYLRSVRTEANSLPSLFVGSSVKIGLRHNPEVAPLQQSRGDKNAEPVKHGGRYLDGTYFAMAPAAPAVVESKSSTYAYPPSSDLIETQEAGTEYLVSPRMAFKARLLELFTQQLDSNPSQIARLEAIPTSEWLERIASGPPKPGQLEHLTSESALQAIQTINAKLPLLISKAESTSSAWRLGLWIWGILRKVGEVGTLDSHEVSIVRELGKSANLALSRLSVSGSNDGNPLVFQESGDIIDELAEQDKSRITEDALSCAAEDEVFEAEEFPPASPDHKNQEANNGEGEKNQEANNGEGEIVRDIRASIGTVQPYQDSAPFPQKTVAQGGRQRRNSSSSVESVRSYYQSPGNSESDTEMESKVKQNKQNGQDAILALEQAKARLMHELDLDVTPNGPLDAAHMPDTVDGSERGANAEVAKDPSTTVRMVLDIILLLTAEAFGQHDLLGYHYYSGQQSYGSDDYFWDT